MMSTFNSPILKQVCAPGLRANEKLHSRLSESSTKARVVNTFESCTNLVVHTFWDCKVSRRKSPCMSWPTLPINAVFNPKFDSAHNTLAGAPPGFCSNKRIPAGDIPQGVKSINNSPRAATSNMAPPHYQFCKGRYS